MRADTIPDFEGTRGGTGSRLDLFREQAGSVQEFVTAKGSRSEIVEG